MAHGVPTDARLFHYFALIPRQTSSPCSSAPACILLPYQQHADPVHPKLSGYIYAVQWISWI